MDDPVNTMIPLIPGRDRFIKEGRKRGNKGIKRKDKKEREIFSELSKAIKVGEVEAGKLILHLHLT